MTRAIRTVTVERGHDPRDFALVAFGGAGPMHAAGLAERLDVDTVLIPPASGVRSAFGLLSADESHDAVQTFRTTLEEADTDAVEAVYDDLAQQVLDDSTDPDAATLTRQADCRYAGQAFELTVDAPDEFDPDTVRNRFVAAHDAERGYRLEDEPVELLTLRVTARTPGERPTLRHDPSGDPQVGTRTAIFEDDARETPIYDPRRVGLDATIDGPAVFEGGESTIVLPPGWQATVDDRGTLRLEAQS